MGKIKIGQKLAIVFIGSMIAFLVLIMSEVLFAEILTNLVIRNIDDLFVLYLIVFGLQLFGLIISAIVGFWITEDIRSTTIIKATILSFLVNLFFWIILSYIMDYFFYPVAYEELSGIEIVFVFPQVMLYFAIYIIGDIILFMLLNQVGYFLFFIVFLESFYERKGFKYEREREDVKW